MAIRITLAKTSAQIDEALKVRYRVFCLEDGKLCPFEGDRIFDRFDTYDTTHHLVIQDGSRVVGTMRMTVDSAVGIPGDESYDFRSHLPSGYKLLNAGMYCVEREFRRPTVAMGAIQMSTYFAVQNGITHVVAPINPVIAKLLFRVGFKALGEKIEDPHFDLPIIPVLLDVKEAKDFFLNFAKRNQLHNFITSYDYLSYDEGDYIIHAGKPGNEAFVIIEGTVDVKFPGQEELIHSMSEGDVFGELALLTDSVRSADVVAQTKVRIMALPKEAFLRHLRNDPDKAIEFMRSIGSRLNDLTQRFPKKEIE